jgi:hypothetical protein
MVAPEMGTLTDPAADTGLTNALGTAATSCARKGAGASDAGQAKDYAAAALSYVQALMAIVSPKVAPGQGQPSAGRQGVASQPAEPS